MSTFLSKVLLNSIPLINSGSIFTCIVPLKMDKCAKLHLLFTTCLPPSHPLGCFLLLQLIYEVTHHPNAVHVDDKPNSSGPVGKLVRIGGCESQEK